MWHSGDAGASCAYSKKMSNLVGSVLEKVVKKYLNEYFTYGSLKVQGVGEFRVHNLELKPEVIPGNLAAKVRTCSLDRVHISVAPLQLFSLNPSYAISVNVDSLKVIMEARPEEEWDERAEFEALKAVKLALIQGIRDEALQAVETKLGSMDGDLVPDTSESSLIGLVKNLAVRVAGNFELHVRKIEAAYHFETSDRSGHIGLTVQGFKLENTNLSPHVEVARSTSEVQDQAAEDVQPGDDIDLASNSVPKAEREVYVGGILVEPLQGTTERIVKKQMLVEGIEVYLQQNIKKGRPLRIKLIEKFNAESILAFNLAADPRPTLGIVEMRLSRVVMKAAPEDVAALIYIGDSLTHQVRWKLWCEERFNQLVQTGISSDDQGECFRIYQKMFEKGKQDIGPETQKPKKPANAATGVDALLAGLSWLEQRELRAHPETIRTIVQSVSAVVAKRQREKILDDMNEAIQPSVMNQVSGTASAWISWALGTSEDPSTTQQNGQNIQPKSIEELKTMAKTARDLSNALGISNETNVDAKKLLRHRRKIFDAIDKDKSGEIDAVELQVGLAMAGTTLSTKKVKDLVQTFDTNRNGRIDFKEFCTMCDLAPARLAKGISAMTPTFKSQGQSENLTQSAADRDRADAKPDVFALSVTVQSVQITLFSQNPTSSSDAPRCVFTMREMCSALAVEGAMNPWIGLRAINFGIRKVNADVIKGEEKLALLAPHGFVEDENRHNPDNKASQHDQESHDADDEDEDDDEGSRNPAYGSQPRPKSSKTIGHDLAESKFRVRVMSLQLAEGDAAPSLSPYCNILYLDESRDTLDEQTTGLIDGSTMKAKQGFAEYDFSVQRNRVPPLEFFVGHGRNERTANIQVQVKQRQDNLGWVRRVVRRRELAVDPIENDLLLCAVDIKLPVRAIPKSEFSRIGSHMYRKYEEWYDLPGGYGKVRLQVESVPSESSTARTPAEALAKSKKRACDTLFEFEALVNQSVMYFDAAIGLTVPQFYMNMRPELVSWSKTLFHAYSAEGLAQYDWNRDLDVSSTKKSPSWRCEKILLDVSVSEIQGLPKNAKVVKTTITCGAEQLGLEGSLQSESMITLGETQNLFQLEATNPDTKINMTFDLSTKKSVRVESVVLKRILSNVRSGPRSMLFWCNSNEENVRVRVCVDVSSPGFEIEQDEYMEDASEQGSEKSETKELDFENDADQMQPTLLMPPTWQQQGQMAQDPPQKEWGQWTQADPFGLASFPPILQQNIAYLNVQVIRACGLPAADITGTSDPYCILKCHHQESRTHTVSRELNPSWEDKPQTSQFKFGPLPGSALGPASPDTLDFEVMDEDFGGQWAHDFLGVAHVPLHELYEQIVRAPREAEQYMDKTPLRRRSSSKRYSQRPASQAEINPAKSVTVWIPLNMDADASTTKKKSKVHYCTNDEDDEESHEGAIQVRMWLEPCGETPRPQSNIPVTLDVTMLLDVAFPTVRIPKDYYLNDAKKTIEISMGKPVMSMQLNNGASDSLVSALSIYQAQEVRLNDLQKVGPSLLETTIMEQQAPLKAKAALSMVEKEEPSDDSKSEQLSLADQDKESFYSVAERPRLTHAGESGHTGSIATNLEDFHSFVTTDDELIEDSSPQDTTTDEEGNGSRQPRSGNLKKPKDDCRKQAKVRQIPKSKLRELDLAFGFYMDKMEIRMSFVKPKRHQKRTHEFLCMSVEGVKMDASYSLYDCGLPLIKFFLQAEQFAIEDKWQDHALIGNHLTDVYPELEDTLSSMERRRLDKLRRQENRPQFRLSIIYQREAEAERLRLTDNLDPVPSLRVGMDLEGLFVLVTPLMHFGLKLASAFSLLDDSGVETPAVVEKAQDHRNAKQKEEEMKLEENPDADFEKKVEPSQDQQKALPGSILPVSEIKVLVRTTRVEFHFMRRHTLCKESQRRLHKYPPKSLIFRVGSEIKFNAIARDFDHDHSCLPAYESLSLRATCDARIAPTKIDRNRFQQIPEDFFSGDNVVLEPFTVVFKLETEPIEKARDLRLAHRLRHMGDSGGSASEDELNGFFDHASGSHFDVAMSSASSLTRNAEENYQNFKLDHEPHEDISHERPKLQQHQRPKVENEEEEEKGTELDPNASNSARHTDEQKQDSAQHNSNSLKDIKAEDIWGVNSHTVLAQQVMREELQKARGDNYATVRVMELRMDGLETRFDTGDIIFLMEVEKKQMELYAEFYPEQNVTSVAEQMDQKNRSDSKGNKRDHGASINSARSSDSDSSQAYFTPVRKKKRVAPVRILTESDIKLMKDIKSNIIGQEGASDRNSEDSESSDDEGLVVGDPGLDDIGTNLELNNKSAKPLKGVGNEFENIQYDPAESYPENHQGFRANDAAPNPAAKKVDGTQSAWAPWMLHDFAPMFIMCLDTSAFRRRLPGDVPGHWNTERDAEILGMLLEQANKSRQTERVFDQANLYVNQLMLGIGNNLNGYPQPFARFSLAQFHLIGCSRTFFSDDLQVRGYVSTTSTSYNTLVRAWEPLIEPWSLLLQAERSTDTGGLLLQAIAPRRINLNITDAFLRSVVSFMRSLDPTYTPIDDERLHGMYTPNWVVNETGHKVELWPISHPDDQYHSTKPNYLKYRGDKQQYVVEEGEARRLHLHDTSRIRAKMAELLQHMRENRRKIVFKTIKYLQNTVRRNREARENDPEYRSERTNIEEQIKSRHKLAMQEFMLDQDDRKEEEEDLRRDLTNLFRFIDEDNSGEISCVELQNALSHYGEPISVEEVLYSIGEMDDEGVENVDASETGIDLREFLDFFVPALLESAEMEPPGLDVHALGFRITDLRDSLPEDDEGRAPSSNEGARDQVVQVPLVNQIGLAPSENAGEFMLQTINAVTVDGQYSRTLMTQNEEEMKRNEHTTASSTTRESSEDEEFDDSTTPAKSPEEDEAEREERRKSKRMSAAQVKGKNSRGYDFIDRNTNSLLVMANVQKIGRSSAGDVLFLETPIRVENRTIVPLRVSFVCHRSSGEKLYEKTMFTLSPGDEQSIPLKYLYAQQLDPSLGGKRGFSVCPVMDRPTLKRLQKNKRGEPVNDESSNNKNQNNRGRTLSIDSGYSKRSNESVLDAWAPSGILVSLEGGQGLRVIQNFRPQDDLLDKRGNVINDLLMQSQSKNEDLDSDLVGASRVCFLPNRPTSGGIDAVYASASPRAANNNEPSGCASREDIEELEDAEYGRERVPKLLECVMLTQRNALHKFEMKEILTVQVLQASNLMAADITNSSDPFVAVATFKGNKVVEKFQTPHIQATLNPIWANKSTFRFGESDRPLSEQEYIRFSVIDWDALSSNDPLGYVTLKVRDIVSWFSAGHAVKTARGVIKKTFMLEAGRGVSKDEVKGSLTIEFGYKRNAAARGGPKRYLQHVFSFYPSLVLENLLSYPIEISLEVCKKSNPEKVLRRHKVKMLKGGRVPFHEMDGALLDYLDPNWTKHHSARDSSFFSRSDPRKMASQDDMVGQVRVRIHFEEGPTSWSDPIEPSSLGTPIKDASESSRTVSTITAEVERTPTQDGGGRRLIICAPFWIANKSDVILDYQVVLADRKKKLELSHTRMHVYDHLPHTVMPLYAPPKSRQIFGEVRLSQDPDAVVFKTATSKQFIMDDESRELQSGLPIYLPLFASKLPGSKHFPAVNLIIMASKVQGLSEDITQGNAVALSCSFIDLEDNPVPTKSYTAAVPGGATRKWPFSSGHMSVYIPGSESDSPAGEVLFELRSFSEHSAQPASSFTQPGEDDPNDDTQETNARVGSKHSHHRGRTSTSPEDVASTSISAASSSGYTSLNAQAFDSLYTKDPSNQRVIGDAKLDLAKILEKLLIQGDEAHSLKIKLADGKGEAQVDLELSLAGVPVDERLISLSTQLMVLESPFRRDIGISLTPMHQTYSRTSLLTIGPKYRVANVTEEPLLIKQAGLPDCTALLLDGRDPALQVDPNDLSDVNVFCFHYQLTPGTRFQIRDDPSRKVFTATEHVQVRLAVSGALWSEPIKLEDLDDFALQLRSGKERKRDTRIWVDANESMPAQMIIFRTLDVDEVDYSVRNKMTNQSFKIVQIPSRGIGLRAAAKRCFRPLPSSYKLYRNAFPPDVVEPGVELSIPLDIPPKDSLRTQVLIIPLRKDGSPDLDYAKAIRYKAGLVTAFPQRSGKDLALSVRTYGLRSSVVISEMTKRARRKAQEEEHATLDRFVRRLMPRDPWVEVLFEISSACLSVFSSTRGLEVMYVCAQRIHFECALEEVPELGTTNKSVTTAEFAVGHFQIDSSQVQAKYPIVMYSRPPKPKVIQEHEREALLCAVSKRAVSRTILLSDRLRRHRAIHSFLRIQLAYESGGASSSFDIVKLLTIAMHKTEVKLDSNLLGGLFQVMTPILGGAEESGSIEGEGAVLGFENQTTSYSEVEWLVNDATNNISVPPQDTIFCERIRVSPTAFITSVSLGSESELEDTLNYIGIPMAYYGLIKRFSRLEDFSFDLSNGYYEAITSHKFQNRYYDKIVRAILAQMHEYVINQGKQVVQMIPFLRPKNKHEKVREPLVPSGGVLVSYGPGSRPNIIENEREKRAAVIVERCYLQYMERKRMNFPEELRPHREEDQFKKSAKRNCLGC